MPDRRLQNLLEQYIGDYVQLDVVSAMALDRDRSWNADEVAHAFGLDINRAVTELEALCARNLLDVILASSVRYRFAPGTPQVAADMEELLAAYRLRPAAVLSLLAEQTRTRRIREFADAFDLRRKRDRG